MIASGGGYVIRNTDIGKQKEALRGGDPQPIGDTLIKIALAPAASLSGGPRA